MDGAVMNRDDQSDERADRQSAGERLKQARIKAGFSGSKAAADRFGWNPNTYKKHEQGWNGFTPAQARTYGRAFHVDPAWLLLGDPAPQGSSTGTHSHVDGHDHAARDGVTRQVPKNYTRLRRETPEPVVNVMEFNTRAGPAAEGTEVMKKALDGEIDLKSEIVRYVWGVPDAFLKYLGIDPAAARMVEVVGDSMYDPGAPWAPGSLFPGDQVFIDIDDRNPFNPGPFAVWDGIGIAIKTLEVASAEPPRLRLSSRNKMYSAYEIAAAETTIVGRVKGRISRI